jgi:hypothetical protein
VEILNQEESGKLLGTIRDCYANQFKEKDFTPESFERQVIMWQRQFADIPFVDVFRAFEIHFGRSLFPPVPSELKLIVAKIQHPDLFMTGEEAWDIVSGLCVSFGFDGQTEAYKHLNQRMKDAIKSSGGWWEHCYSERPYQIKANFIQTWEIKAAPEREKILLPQQVAMRLEQMKEKQNEPKQLPNV